MAIVPPSPALSFCETLSSPELERYLDSLPPLDSLPSPGMKDAWWINENEHCHRSGGRHDSLFDDEDSSHIAYANVLCAITPCDGCEAVRALPVMIAQFLENSQLPLEAVAVAYNILASPRISSLHCWHDDAPAFASEDMRAKMIEVHGPLADPSCQRALIILSTLSVAVSFTEDCPRSLFYWSRQVAKCAFSTEQIGAMNRVLLAQLDWQIHPLAAPGPVSAAVNALSQMVGKPKAQQVSSPFFQGDSTFKLSINTHTASQYGLITPEPSPDCLIVDNERVSYLTSV